MIAIFAVIAALIGVPHQSADQSYKLVWSDEFNHGDRLNGADWNYESGFVRNEEDQWYQPANAYLRDGKLVIEARRERVVNPDYKAGDKEWRRARQYAEYTSASVTTQGKHAWKYGRFEMRARFNTASGNWPAFWTLGAEGEWPSNGEIDIMEYYRGDLLANVAWGSSKRWQAIWSTTKRPISSLAKSAKDWESSFHTWRMDWDESSIALYADGKLLNRVSLSSAVNKDGTCPFKRPHYIILNLAIGGQNGGDPSQSMFPSRFEIDWVRVYQKETVTATAVSR
jgi:beta-glucanase (GH16 family)